MSEQHKATPEQWADQEMWAPSDGASSCLLPYDQLSTATKAVLDAGLLHAVHRFSIAAAIEALADQVACQIPDECRADVFNRQLRIRSEILAIAAELAGDATANQET